MINWLWLIAALYVGFGVGVFLMCLLQVSRSDAAGETNEVPTLRTH